MRNFSFHSTTKIIFGQDTEQQVGQETALYGKKVLQTACGAVDIMAHVMERYFTTAH